MIQEIKEPCPFCGNKANFIKLRAHNRTVINNKVYRNCYCYCPKCDTRSTRELYCNFETSDMCEEAAVQDWNRRI